MACSGTHRKRLFIGEAGFLGVWSLLDKHKDRHPNLGKSIIATELENFDRNADDCPACQQRYNEQDEDTLLSLAMSNLFIESGNVRQGVFCSDRCKRIQALKDRDVTVILGYDGTGMHKHPLTQGKTFKRIHWNCPHDGSNYRNQTLPTIIKKFFKSAAKMQQDGHRVHVTLAQPPGSPAEKKPEFYQGVIYNIRDAAESRGYKLYAKRSFGAERYPGYIHQRTGSTESAVGAERLREFVFVKGPLSADRPQSREQTGSFYLSDTGYIERGYYERDTDEESSNYSSSDESDF